MSESKPQSIPEDTSSDWGQETDQGDRLQADEWMLSQVDRQAYDRRTSWEIRTRQEVKDAKEIPDDTTPEREVDKKQTRKDSALDNWNYF